jgi:hypothetical protein
VAEERRVYDVAAQGLYDEARADEAYRSGVREMTAGNTEEALR